MQVHLVRGKDEVLMCHEADTLSVDTPISTTRCRSTSRYSLLKKLR